MNIRITHNWLLEYLDTKATPEEIQKYLSLCGPSVEHVDKIGDDFAYEIEVTSNRIDTASVVGIAREACAILNRFGIKAAFKSNSFKEPKLPRSPVPIEIIDRDHLCHRLLAVVMDNVTIKPSPKYVQDRLEAADIRSLNNVVDITNYVMTEIGHPTHVFDYDRIKTHKLIIRKAKNNEEITTLDEKKYKLSNQDIIIDDGTGRVIDLPGIMGTANSVVTPETKRILFFIESNDPIAIRRSSMKYGIRTMAATINEKAPDPETTKQAFLRGMELFEKLAGGRVSSKLIDVYPQPQKAKSVAIDMKDVSRVMGVDIEKKEVVQILVDLGFDSQSENGDSLTFTVPSFRYNDVSIKEDLIEEIARIHGYFNLPNNLQPMVYIKQPKELENLFLYESKIKYFLKHLGLHEVINYSMVSEDLLKKTGLHSLKHLILKNTISEEIKYLRTSLLPSLVKNMRDNEGKEALLKLFEIAKVYKPQEGKLPEEDYRLAIATSTDFQDLKGIIDALLLELNIENYKIDPTVDHIMLEKGWGNLRVGNDAWVEFGQLKRTFQMDNQLKNNIFLAEFNLQPFIKHAKQYSKYVLASPYATIKLDVTLVPTKSYLEFKKMAFESSELLTKLEFVNSYDNNITLRFYFSSSSKNITEQDAKVELQKIIQ